jgi:methylenetetrahydrofolate dehydrogenase (NADP+)/methenyltetrahydrofolate cyclohydrolase
MKLLNGKKLSEKILTNLKREIKKSQLQLKLAVVQIGQNSVSQIFISQKKKACEKTGINFKLFKFPAKISILELKKEIKKITKNPANSGIIIQLPLPKKFLPEEFLNLIPKEKDIDVLSEESLGKFYQGTLKILPPTVNGILRLLKNYKIELKGKNIVVIGAGRLVGFPLAVQLLKEKATLSALNEFTKDAPSFTKKADILISGVGKPNLIESKMVKKGVVIIDAGSAMKKGKLVGDVDSKSVSKKINYITPVPGGVGPMTVACLLENLVRIHKR